MVDYLDFLLSNAFGVVVIFSVIIFFGIINSFFYIVRQSETIVIERFGKFHKVLEPGFHWVVPFIESPHIAYWSHVNVEQGSYYLDDINQKLNDTDSSKKSKNYFFIKKEKAVYRIDLRERVYDFPKQHVITRDNVNIEINALLYYRITDVISAVYKVYNLPEAIEKLTQTTLRNVIGSLDLDETLVSRDQINTKLRIILDEATDQWGVKIDRVELQEINVPSDIRHAMEKQMRAERNRRAIILDAEGKKSASILEAEGYQQSNILRAKGDSESRIIEAEGKALARLKVSEAEAQSIQYIQNVTKQGQDSLSYMIASEYIKVLPEVLKGSEGKTVVIPYEISGVMGSLSIIKNLFEQQNNKKDKELLK